jgi:hypothetical protein
MEDELDGTTFTARVGTGLKLTEGQFFYVPMEGPCIVDHYFSETGSITLRRPTQAEVAEYARLMDEQSNAQTKHATNVPTAQ